MLVVASYATSLLTPHPGVSGSPSASRSRFPLPCIGSELKEGRHRLSLVFSLCEHLFYSSFVEQGLGHDVGLDQLQMKTALRETTLKSLFPQGNLLSGEEAKRRPQRLEGCSQDG